MKELIGEYITGLKVNDDQSLLFVETRRALYIFKTNGECCSETWFADIIGVKYLIGATVYKVEDLELSDYNVDDGRRRNGFDEAYGIKLITDKGETTIIYRNSSNGYYGGDMCLLCEASNLTEITEDWQA